MNKTIIKDLIFHPKKAFVEITSNEKEYFGIALIIVGIQLVVGLFEFGRFTSFLETGSKTIGYQFYLIVSIVFAPFLVAWLLVKISKKLLKIQSNFKKVFSAIQFAFIPYLLIGTPIKAIIFSTYSENISIENFFTSMPIIVAVIVPFAIWSIILWIMACKQSLQLNATDVIAVGILVMIIVGAISLPISILFNGLPFQVDEFEI